MAENPSTPEPRKAAKSAKASKSTPAKATKATKAKKATKAAKATKSAKATKAAAKTPAKPVDPVVAEPAVAEPVGAEPALPEPAVVVPSPAGPAAPGVWAQAAWEALQQFDQPPRRLAELAVAELGPRAAAWAGWLRQTYPDPPSYGLARLATRQATRGGLALALAEAGGPYSAPLLLPATAWVKATVVLRIAAAYGHDPTDPQRVTDLINLLDLDPTEPDPDPTESVDQPGAERAGPGGVAGVAWLAGRFGAVRFASNRLRLHRTAAAMLRALIAASDYHDSLRRLAHRAALHYRGAQPGSSAGQRVEQAAE